MTSATLWSSTPVEAELWRDPPVGGPPGGVRRRLSRREGASYLGLPQVSCHFKRRRMSSLGLRGPWFSIWHQKCNYLMSERNLSECSKRSLKQQIVLRFYQILSLNLEPTSSPVWDLRCTETAGYAQNGCYILLSLCHSSLETRMATRWIRGQ